jgi:hypothetical protein
VSRCSRTVFGACARLDAIEPTVQKSTEGITKLSGKSVADTIDQLRGVMEDRRFTVFNVIDHSGVAERAGVQMPDSKLVMFGKPTVGAAVMLAAPLAALDIPLKVLVCRIAAARRSRSPCVVCSGRGVNGQTPFGRCLTEDVRKICSLPAKGASSAARTRRQVAPSVGTAWSTSTGPPSDWDPQPPLPGKQWTAARCAALRERLK